jgi:hypothetical protein
MAADHSGLVRAAMELRRVDSAMWAGFVAAMAEYAHAMTQEMLKAPPDMLIRAQGMSLMAHEIAGILSSAPQLYEKIQGKQHVRPSHKPAGTGF